MRRNSQIIVIAIIVVVFSGPLIAFLAGVRPELDENRARTRFPALNADTVVDDATYAKIALAYTDRLPLRDHALQFYSRMQDASTFSDSAGRPGQPAGADGWLYFPDDLAPTCTGPPPEEFLQAGREASEAATVAGVPFYFVVAPDKAAVYPEHAPKEGLAGVLGLRSPDLMGCLTSWRNALDDAAEGEPWLQPLAGALRARAAQSDEPLYFKQDTHWTDLGALSQVQQIVDDVAPGMWDPDEVQSAGPSSKIGDLSRLVGRPQREETEGLKIVRPGVTVTGSDADNLNDDTATVVRTKATSTDAPLVEGTTLFISDSFGRRSVKLLAPYFEELVVVSREQLIKQPIATMLVTRPDRVVIEQVQRNLAKGWWPEGLDAVVAVSALPPKD